jgi:hypothetical protein
MQAENIGLAASTTQPMSKTTSLFLGKLRALLLFIGILMLGQHAFENDWAWDFSAVLILSSLFGCALLWRVRKGLISALCSVHFAIVLGISIALSTALGTFIPQNDTLQGLEDRFGESATVWLQRFFLDNLFHSFWFCGMLALLALALTFVVVRRKFWLPSQWGFLLTHGGTVAVLAGALIGNMFGTRGNLELKVGSDSSVFIDEDNLAHPLGFSVKLDAFDIEKYPIEHRLYVLGEGTGNASIIQTSSIKDSRTWKTISGTSNRYRIVEYYPDIDLQDSMAASLDGAAPSAVRIKVQDGARSFEKWLPAGINSNVAKGLQLQYLAGGDAALIAATSSPTPAKHQITINHEALEVRLGQSWTVAASGRQFKLVDFMPDYYYDFEKKCSATRGANPNNPAICIEEITAAGNGERQWIFANMPGHGRKPDQLEAVYKYIPPVPPLEQLWGVDSKTQELLFAQGGKIILRQPFKPGQPQRINIAASEENGPARDVTLECMEVLEHAVPCQVARSLSQEAKNPGVLLEIDSGEIVRKGYLVASHAESLPVDNTLRIVFQARAAQPKEYRSQVSIIEDGATIKKAAVAVNAPLQFKGYQFYQSSYRSDKKGDFSIFKVVNDPGLGAVYTGLIMVGLGVLYIYYIRPRKAAGANVRTAEVQS